MNHDITFLRYSHHRTSRVQNITSDLSFTMPTRIWLCPLVELDTFTDDTKNIYRAQKWQSTRSWCHNNHLLTTSVKMFWTYVGCCIMFTLQHCSQLKHPCNVQTEISPNTWNTTISCICGEKPMKCECIRVAVGVVCWCMLYESVCAVLARKQHFKRILETA